MHTNELLESINYGESGLVTAVAQDYETGEVLMLAYMSETSLRRTIETGVMTYWSRSRGKLWVKGETSGNTQEVREVFVDCDGDAVLFKVKQSGGAACHTGHRSCFFRRYDGGRLVTDEAPAFDPKDVYGV